MTRRGPRGYADLHHVSEDERIRIIGNAIMRGETVGVFIDADPEKITRYVRKLQACFPAATLLKQAAGPVPKVVTLQFGLKEPPKEEAANG
jgi:hypothetical protein